MIGFKRILSAPKLLVGLFLFQLILVSTSSIPAGAATRSAIGNHHVFVDPHFLATTAELALTHPAWRSTFLSTPLFIGFAGLLFWQLASAGIFSRLARPIDLGTWASECIRFALPMFVVRMYLGIIQILLIAPAIVLLSNLSSWSKLIVVVLLTFLLAITVYVQDVTRAEIVLHSAPRYHPRNIYFGVLSLLRSPGHFIMGITLICAQWTISLILFYWSTQHFHQGSTLWFARLFSLIPLFLGLWRMALAIEVSPNLKPTNQ